MHEITSIDIYIHSEAKFAVFFPLECALGHTWSLMMCFSCSPMMISATGPPARHAKPTNRCTYFEVRLAEFATGQSVHVF